MALSYVIFGAGLGLLVGYVLGLLRGLRRKPKPRKPAAARIQAKAPLKTAPMARSAPKSSLKTTPKLASKPKAPEREPRRLAPFLLSGSAGGGLLQLSGVSNNFSIVNFDLEFMGDLVKEALAALF